MKNALYILPFLLSLLTLILSACGGTSPEYWPTDEWKRASPESRGMDSQIILDALKETDFDRIRLHSLLVIKDGFIVSEVYRYPHTRETRHVVNSVTKSFTSALVGIAIGEGLIKNVRQKVLPFFDQSAVNTSDKRWKLLTVEDLLTMRSGLNWNDFADSRSALQNTFEGMVFSDSWSSYVLSTSMMVPPGLVFDYNTGNSQLLSEIIHRTSGGRGESFARERLFDPIGIKDYYWRKDPRGVPAGGYGLAMRSEDIARLGFLYINNGRWNKRQIIPRNWVRRSVIPRTLSKMQVNPGAHYAYHWWVIKDTAYSAQGYGGQFLIVFPEKNLIIVSTGNIDYRYGNDLGKLFLKKIPSSITSSKPLHENKPASDELAAYCASFALPFEKKQSNISGSIRKSLGRKISFEKNAEDILSITLLEAGADYIKFEFEQLNRAGGKLRTTFTAGIDNRYRGNPAHLRDTFFLFGETPVQVLARVINTDEKSLTIELVFPGLTTGPIIDRLNFDGDEVTLTITFADSGRKTGVRGKFE